MPFKDATSLGTDGDASAGMPLTKEASKVANKNVRLAMLSTGVVFNLKFEEVGALCS